MKEEKNNRNKWIHVRLNETEAKQVQVNFKSTTEQRMSSYLRNVLLKKPMIKGIRDESLNDIVAILFELRKDLNGVANNFNQAVHKLHTLDTYIDIKVWLMSFEGNKNATMKSIEDIKLLIDKTSEKWLQS